MLRMVVRTLLRGVLVKIVDDNGFSSEGLVGRAGPLQRVVEGPVQNPEPTNSLT